MGDLTAAQRAYRQADWAAALRHLDAAEPERESAAGLELRAMAAYGNGDYEASVSAWEQLSERHAADDEPADAARAAAMAAMFLLIDTGLMATVRGWLRRAERLLVGLDGTPAHALIAATRTYERFMCGDMAEAARQADTAIALGERHGVTAAVVIGRTSAARIRVIEGDVAEGLAELDEIGALLTAGGADPLTTGMMYCELICAAQGMALYDRAREWTELMDRWRGGAAMGGIDGRCRVHRAELLRLSGPCDAAETEALHACEELRPWMRREFGWPLVELGTIRLRKGDLAGAEEALLEAHRHTWSPHPSLALLRLEQGDVAAAVQLIDDALEHPLDIPSKERPPYGELPLAPLLDARSEIAHAAGDAATAREAATRLAAIADRYPSRSLTATADLAEARAALLEGDPATAVTAARRSATAWADIGAPFETAAARTVMAEGYVAQGNPAAAQLERQAATAGYAHFGAALRSDRSRALVTSDHAIGATASTPAPVELPAAPSDTTSGLFRADGGTRTVGLGSRTVTVPDLVGLRYVARLLAEPGREFHALDMTAVEHGTPAEGRPDAQQGLPVLDEPARRAYRRRLAEIDEDIDDATAANDLGRLALAQRDREYLIVELQRAVGLRGRARTTGGSAERARSSVTRSIRYALKRLADHQPELAAHLEGRIRTGAYCCYEPDPLLAVTWRL